MPKFDDLMVETKDCSVPLSNRVWHIPDHMTQGMTFLCGVPRERAGEAAITHNIGPEFLCRECLRDLDVYGL